MKKKLCYLIFFISIIVNSQSLKKSRVIEIDNLISDIPINPIKTDTFNQIQSSGLITKKSWIFFKQQLGSFHENVIYKNKIIYLIKKYTEYKNEAYNEYYYYENDKLIKYSKEILIEENHLKKEKCSAYFEQDKIIEGINNGALDIDSLLKYSYQKYWSWKEFVNQNE